MYNLVCQYCGVNFKNYNGKRKFCSKECYNSSRKGVKRPEHGEKIRKIMLAKNETYKGTKRAENISKAHKKEGLTIEQTNKIIEGIEKYYYVKNPEILLKKIGLWDELRGGLRQDTITNLIKNHNTFFKGQEYFPLHIQKKSREEIDDILKESQYVPWDELIKAHSISFKEYLNLLKKHGINKYEAKRLKINRQTKPEKIVQSILDKYNIDYEREKYIKHRTFRCDFVVDNKYIIEVEGDYWHGNPRLFDEKDLNYVQKDRVWRDKNKFEYALNNNYNIIEIWEMDIYNKIEKVQDMIYNIFIEGEDYGKHVSSEIL